jgi:hypothetical protein
MSRRLARIGWGLWHVILVIATLGLLGVVIYAWELSPDDGPGAGPLLMAGVLSLSMVLLVIVSAVDAVLWATAAGWPRWRRIVLVPVALILGLGAFMLALYTNDSADPFLNKVGLVLLAAVALIAHLLNRRAVKRFRARA